ncbi:hypothetical protein, partial [Limosilactobacillus coleohominis]
LIFVYPLAKTNTVYLGDDMVFQLQRIKEMTENIKSWNYFVGIYTHTFGKIGYPLNLFYPWVTILPFSFFSILCNDQVVAFYLGIAFYNLLTLSLTYVTIKKYSQNWVQAYVSACLYGFSTYRIIDAFKRFALGEYIALTFLTLCIYGMYAILKGNYHDWPYLAFGFSFVLLSHLLSVILNSVLLIILLVLLIPHINDIKKRVVAFMKAIIVSILSSAIFIFPFIEQELFQKYPQPDVVDLATSALLPTKLFSASLDNNINRAIFGGNTYNIGIVILTVAIISPFTLRRLKRDYKVIYFLGWVFTILSTSLFPWSLFQNTVVSVIQFPWRFLGIATMLFSIVGGASICELLQTKKLNDIKLGIYLSCIFVFVVTPYISSMHYLKKNMLTAAQQVRYTRNGQFIFSGMNRLQRLGSFHFQNYTPQKGQHVISDLCNHTAYVNGKAKRVYVEAKANELAFTSNKFAKATNIVFPIMNYKNLQVNDSRGRKVRYSTDKYNRIMIKSPERTSTFKVKYRLSWVDCISEITSFLTWFVAIVMWLYRRRALKVSQLQSHKIREQRLN